MNSNDFRKRQNAIMGSLENTVSDLKKGYNEASRVRNIVENTGQILDDLDE